MFVNPIIDTGPVRQKSSLFGLQNVRVRVFVHLHLQLADLPIFHFGLLLVMETITHLMVGELSGVKRWKHFLKDS